MDNIGIERDPRYYTTGYKGKDPYKAPFYLRSLLFDKEEGVLTGKLIDDFNQQIIQREEFKDWGLLDTSITVIPKQIVIINASSDDLPTSYETARIFEYESNKRGWDIDNVVVNDTKELIQQVNRFPSQTLIISQCVDKKVYNVDVAKNFDDRNIVVVPGQLTAPGSIFSNKDKTYKLLSNGGKNWDIVARYKKIDVEGKKVKEVVEEILDTVDEFAFQFNIHQFFIKPVEGGGGLGGFRLIKSDKSYIIPDLSRVSGEMDKIKPTYLNIDLNDQAKLKELLWIYNLFKSDDSLYSNYIKFDIKGDNKKERLKYLRKYLNSCKKKQTNKLYQMRSSREVTKEQLILAINEFEKKFNRRYIPLVNQHIDFGTWGLRAHFRLSHQGPELETIYARIFQLAFTPQGIGYVGADNISNKQTGELEIKRLCPINQVMVNAIGGKPALFEVLNKAAKAMVKLVDLASPREKRRIPFRIQLDLATISKLIGEVNADTARGLCLASDWRSFVKNTTEWFIDSIKYYSQMKLRLRER